MTQGWASIPRWLLYSADITANAKLVYVVIQSHVDDRGTAYPSRETIAAEAGLSVATVKRAVRELQQIGVVAAVPRRDRAGRQASNLYRVSTTRP